MMECGFKSPLGLQAFHLQCVWLQVTTGASSFPPSVRVASSHHWGFKLSTFSTCGFKLSTFSTCGFKSLLGLQTFRLQFVWLQVTIGAPNFPPSVHVASSRYWGFKHSAFKLQLGLQNFLQYVWLQVTTSNFPPSVRVSSSHYWGSKLSAFSTCHFWELVVGGFRRVLRFLPLLHRLYVSVNIIRLKMNVITKLSKLSAELSLRVLLHTTCCTSCC